MDDLHRNGLDAVAYHEAMERALEALPVPVYIKSVTAAFEPPAAYVAEPSRAVESVVDRRPSYGSPTL